MQGLSHPVRSRKHVGHWDNASLSNQGWAEVGVGHGPMALAGQGCGDWPCCSISGQGAISRGWNVVLEHG